MTYKNRDFNTAVVLHAMGCKLDSTEKNHRGECVFHFQSNDLLHQVLDQRLRDEILLSPEKIFYSERFLRNIMKQESINY